MFSSVAQGTRGSAPVVNPFAPTASQGGTNPFGIDVARKPVNNPFQSTDANLSDGSGSDKGRRKGKGTARKQDGTKQNGLLQPPGRGSRATSPSSISSDDVNGEAVTVVPYNAADPLARKMYEQLRKDGISPPSWPSQPGNPKNKQAMAKFRDQYEAYRKRVRVSLTKAGLIDDPEKRKALSDAIEFKGVCEDMCPEFEKITRITELDVVHAEKEPRTGFASTSKMVKKLARSAAGQEAPLPMDVRSVPALRRTLDYLLDDLLRDDGNLPVVHGFLWDRTRAIRRDFSFFSSLTPDEIKTQVYVLENIARFHVTSLHLLSQEGKAPEDFVQQQELEQLGKALLSLRDVYDDCNEQGIKCENEAEFRAYYLVFHARDPSILETLQRQWKPHLWRDSDEVRTAVSLVEALQDTHDFHGPLKDGPSLAASAASQAYFRIVRDPKVSYTMACFAECHFPQLRRSILQTIKRALARPKDPAKDVTAAALNRFLQFDTIQQAIDFAELHGLEFVDDPDNPGIERRMLLLDGRRPLPHRRLQHHYSQTLVERKRGSTPLPQVIHSTVFEDPTAKVNGVASEGSLFVQDKPRTEAKVGGFGGASTSTSPSPFGTVAAPNPQAASPFGGSQNAQPPVTKNPFASSAPNTLASNPFSSTPAPIFAPKANTEDKPKPVFGGAVANPFALPPQPAEKPIGTKPSFPSATTATPFSGLLGSKPTPDVKPSLSFSMPPPPLPQPKPPAASQPPSLGLGGFKPAQPATSPFGVHSTSITGASPSPTNQPSILDTSKPSAIPPLKPDKRSIPATSPPIVPPQISVNGPDKPSLFGGGVPPPVAPKPVVKPRDLMLDFTKWFVMGDNGILEQFQVYMIDELIRETFDLFQREAEEERQRQEEERINQQVEEFRTYNLSLKYFYRWKQNAREKRLSTLRRSGRDQLRAFYASQQGAERAARKEAAKKAAKQQAELARVNRPEEFMHMLKQKDVSRREAREALLSSGVLSGVDNERHVVDSIVRQEFRSRTNSVSTSYQSRDSSPNSSRKLGGKTKALRDLYLGKPGRFRRSLPSISSRDSEAPENSTPTSNASARWRLKAMGIVQLPDGTAVPESMAHDMVARPSQYSSLAFGSTIGHDSTRRASVSESIHGFGSPLRKMGIPTVDDGSATNKRKRSSVNDADKEESTDRSKHKRIMSEAEKLTSELRAIRKELEEGREWFKSQNERLRSESRAESPWLDGI